MDKFVKRKLNFKQLVVNTCPLYFSKNQIELFEKQMNKFNGKCKVLEKDAECTENAIVLCHQNVQWKDIEGYYGKGSENSSFVNCAWLNKCLSAQELKDVNEFAIEKQERKRKSRNEYTWIKEDSYLCYHCCALQSEGYKNILAFDMDSTLIETKSKKKFPVDHFDWKWIAKFDVKRKLKSESEKGNLIAMVSNQGGVANGKVQVKHLQEKIQAMMEDLNIPVIAYFSIKDDLNRKPRIGLYEELVKMVPTASSITYIGDAAGRPKTKFNNKDFSCSDYKFALNAKIPFMTPEKYFLNSALSVHTDSNQFKLGFDPRSAFTFTDTLQKNILEPARGQEIVVLVGSPGIGKSFFCQHHLSSYTRVNRDTLHTDAKCKTVCTEAIQSGNSVVIDATNPTIPHRRVWVNLAASNNIPIRCVHFDLSKDIALHLNKYRSLTSDVQSVPLVAIHTYYKRLYAPIENEEFTKVTTIHTPLPILNNETSHLIGTFL